MPEDANSKTKPTESDAPAAWSTASGFKARSQQAARPTSGWRRLGARLAGSSLTTRLVALSIVAGLLSGGVGAYGYVHYFAASAPAVKQQLVVQESSAVIDVAKKVSPSVVSITSKSIGQGFFGQSVEQDGAGTGIIVSSDGLIMTNKHVVADTGASYAVITSDGKEYADARVVARDPINDVAFVRISASGLPAAEMGDSGSVQIGQKVVAIGNALGQFQNTVTDGIISGVGRPVTAGDASSSGEAETLTNLFQTDAAINPGNSGGPLLNLAGQVIGINTAVASGSGSTTAQNIGFAIPINEAKSLIASVKDKGQIIRPYLGVRYVPLTKDIAVANKLKASSGAWLQGTAQTAAIIEGGPAAKAGLKDGDIITKVAGEAITSINSLQSLVGKHKAGDKVALTVLREGKTQTINVTLEAAPAGQ